MRIIILGAILTGCAPVLGTPVASFDGVECFDGDRPTGATPICEARVLIEMNGAGRDCTVAAPRVDPGRPVVTCPGGSFGFCAMVPVALGDACAWYLGTCPAGARCEVPFDPTTGELGDLVIID